MNNNSGHYQPDREMLEQTRSILDAMGVRVSGARFFGFDAQNGGFVDLDGNERRAGNPALPEIKGTSAPPPSPGPAHSGPRGVPGPGAANDVDYRLRRAA